ncbi:MAG TPA: chemotaxis protein CheC [Blastocatellia bacterium]|jgi:chemotaxis protein CheC|nr:chemotaxis protein CheC [Blastocatellia bacterium]
MQLSERQNDALTELINIAFSRTAASLSELTGHRVVLDVPKVAIYPVNELAARLAAFLPFDLASVHQVFTGPLTGDALLLLNYDGAVSLTELLTDEYLRSHRLNESAREVLTEVGNILLNACLGVFGNLLQVRISFSVPRLHLETLGSLLNSLIIDKEELRYALVVYTAFRVRDSAISGYLVIALSVVSLDRLIQEVEKWEENQGNL